MKRVLVGAAVVAAGCLGASAPPASACDPNMPTCYGVESWLNGRLYYIDRYLVEPTQQRVEELRESFDLGCPGPYC